jgi:hypothetical protein
VNNAPSKLPSGLQKAVRLLSEASDVAEGFESLRLSRLSDAVGRIAGK